MIGSYTKGSLAPEARVQEFLYYFEYSYITGTSVMLQLFSSKSRGHGNIVGQALSIISSSFVVALMVSVRNGVTTSSHSIDKLELI